MAVPWRGTRHRRRTGPLSWAKLVRWRRWRGRRSWAVSESSRPSTEAWPAPGAGISALVTIVGDGGMGKTRLAEEAVDRAEGFAVAWGSGWPGAGAPPLWPWQAVFEQLGATSEAELLDHDAPTETERFARFRALSQTIAGVTADHPVLIVIDDAHEIDAGALLLARFVVRTLRTAPLAVIVAARPTPGDTQAAMAEVARESIVVDLAGLGVDDIDALVAAAGAGGLENLGAALHALTAGNPFLLHEALAGSGNELAILERAGRRLEERLTGFGDDDLVVFGAGAVLAPAPDLRMVAEVAAAAPAAVHHAYREGVRRGVLNPAPAAPFTFVHDLLREAVRRSAPPDRPGPAPPTGGGDDRIRGRPVAGTSSPGRPSPTRRGRRRGSAGGRRGRDGMPSCGSGVPGGLRVRGRRRSPPGRLPVAGAGRPAPTG